MVAPLGDAAAPIVSETAGFGGLLRQHRMAASLSQEALAERTNLSAKTIASLERERRTAPRPSTVLLLAEALALDPVQRAALIGAARSSPNNNVARARRFPGSLPISLTSFIGRVQELSEVQRLLATTRLLTLTGSGGVGKSRLAVEVARGGPEKVVFVEFASLGSEDVAVVPSVLAAALGVQERPGIPVLDTLTASIGARRLLVWDNCEHLLPTCSYVAEAVLGTCPNVRLLAASREPFGLAGEVVWRVPGLPVPNLATNEPVERIAQNEAVRLFVDRAAAALPGFELDNDTAPAVAQVCARLNGIPLAIELAAARVRVLAPEQIAVRLADRFDLLVGTGRTALARHQTLRAAIDWSYALLSAAERQLFNRLAVFAGSWTLEAAETVCAGSGIQSHEILDLLSRLVDRSLVLARPAVGGILRYRFLETIRQYASQHLELTGEADAVRERHRAWCIGLAEQALGAYWWGVNIVQWLALLEREQANFRAALHYSVQRGEAELGMRLAAGLWVLWGFRGSWSEGRDWIARLLALPEATRGRAARADVLGAAGQMALQQGEFATAQRLLVEALHLQRQVGDARGLAMTATHAGLAARARGEFALARELHEEAVAVARTCGNRRFEAVSLAAVAHTVYLHGDFALARSLAEESLAIVRSLAKPHGMLVPDMAIPHYVLGRVALCCGQPAVAREQLEATVAVWHATGDLRSTVGALVGLGDVALLERRPSQARELLTSALALSDELGSRVGVVYALEGFAMLDASEGEDVRAIQLAGAADRLRSSMQHPISPAEEAVLERSLGAARNALGDVAEAAWLTGHELNFEDAIELARTGNPTARTASSEMPSGVPWSALTLREQEVAALVSCGLSNPQIGRELRISPRTVKRHMENILTRLCFASRTQVAAWVVAQGMCAKSTSVSPG
jgi:predicted ATPase/DNA-binding CsgD family transcriptional regulator/DNA-binding XRE family transcriptional regulator